MRQVAYCGVFLGLGLTIFAHEVAFSDASDANTSRLQVLREELDLLMGGTQTAVPMWTRLVAWAGVISWSAAAAIVLRTDRATED